MHFRKAIKKISLPRDRSPKKLGRIFQEADYLLNFDHPNILKGFTKFEDQEFGEPILFLVTEYCEVSLLFESCDFKCLIHLISVSLRMMIWKRSFWSIKEKTDQYRENLFYHGFASWLMPLYTCISRIRIGISSIVISVPGKDFYLTVIFQQAGWRCLAFFNFSTFDLLA